MGGLVCFAETIRPSQRKTHTCVAASLAAAVATWLAGSCNAPRGQETLIDKVEVQAASKKVMDVLTTWQKVIAATGSVGQPEATVTRLKRVLH